MNVKIRVAVLLGGDSSEREISFRSGVAMASALSSEKYNVTMFDVATAQTRGRSESTRSLALGDKPRHACLPVEWNQLATTLYTMPFDAVLPALHGGWGEDGTLQSILDVAGIPYAGSTAHACAIAINKQVCKAFMKDLGIAVPRGVLITAIEELNDSQNSWIHQSPVVVKPNEGGSSVAVTILKEPDAAQLQAAVAAALADGSSALVEELIEGTEITCATRGEGASTQALPLIEIVPQSSSAFYDYEAKYAVGGSQHLIPPRISEEASTRVAACAIKAHRALGCRGVARSDYIVDKNGTPYFLEINTIPGMTQTSLVPDAARAAGTGFEKLVESLIEDATNRKSKG
jgi:D-alanine-D-alanine ligase